ncbi:phosphotransferase family protein [Cryobacterium sp. AP23]
MTGAPELLNESTVIPWAKGQGIVPEGHPLCARALAGGVSNIVLAVKWESGGVVVKQSLPQLRVADRWDFDRARIITERKALSYLQTVIPGHVPTVVGADDDAFAFAMTYVPAGEVWKAQLMRGELSRSTARAAADILATIQLASRVDHAALEDFADRMPLIQGRIEPYHRAAAQRNPELAPIVHAHAQRLIESRDVLVLGDFAPKNLLVDGDTVVVIDVEVAHLGDPCFDVAFLLTHLILKHIVLPGCTTDLLELATEFWLTYQTRCGAAAAPEGDVVIAVGCLLLARVDGKSPVEYLGVHGPSIRATARDILTTGATEPLLAVLARALHEQETS